MKNTALKQKLKNKESTIGSWITIPHQSVIDILAEAGFDWLCIDLEHTAIDYNEVQVLIGFIQARGMAALVRVSKNEEVVIKRVLDSGADGIIVPMVCTADEAKQAVEYAKYPPVGKRGVGLNRAQRYGFGFEDYRKWVDDNLVIIAQIEHFEGINNLEQIIATPGIDGVFIGPYDLSSSLGIPGQFNEPVVQEALRKFEEICLEKNFSMGYHVIDPDIELVKEKHKAGYNFIAFSTDFLFMGRKALNEMKNLNN
jgi:2-dehydro-3-deoxyglucarate aldolase